MRLFVSGSAPLPAQVLEEFREKFGHTILERYGMTETLMNISNPYAGERRPGSVGFPLARHLRAHRPQPPSEICSSKARTSSLAIGGARMPRARLLSTARSADGSRPATSRPGLDDGYYTLRGRRSDLIISGGFNIYPREIEEFLAAQPGVAEAAVVGEPDRVRGEIPVAYIVVQQGVPCDMGRLEAACKRNFGVVQGPATF